MRIVLAPFVVLSIAAAPLAGQQAESDVLAVVQQLFDGMRARDTARMRSVLHPEASLVSTAVREGVPVVRLVPPSQWLAGIVQAPPGVLDERISNPVVHVQGGLAAVWVEYSFYLGDRLSHCGVDSFHLVRTPDGWRIVDLADTQRRDGCAP